MENFNKMFFIFTVFLEIDNLDFLIHQFLFLKNKTHHFLLNIYDL
jgi:hypothetical protein